MKILIVKLSSLGDVVHAMPAVQDIRRALPGAQIDWVVERGFAPLVQRCQGVRRVIACELRRWRKVPLSLETRRAWGAFKAELQQEQYDAVIDLQGLSKSALISWLARLTTGGKRYSLANQTEGSSFEVPARWVADVAITLPAHSHAVTRSRELCAQALAYSVPDVLSYGLRAKPGRTAALATADRHGQQTRLHHPNERHCEPPVSGPIPHTDLEPGPRHCERSAAVQAVGSHGLLHCVRNDGGVDGKADRPWQSRVALVHGTSRADKQWPLAHWRELALRLNAAGFGVALPHGNPAEEQTSRDIAHGLVHAQVWPLMALDALTDALATCSGVIGVDSGLSHIAVALDLPHVQIYNFDTAWRTGPLAAPTSDIVIASEARQSMKSGPQDCRVTTFLSMNTLRHCEQSEAIHDYQQHGLPRYARSDGDFVHGPCAVSTGYGWLAMTEEVVANAPRQCSVFAHPYPAVDAVWQAWLAVNLKAPVA